MGKGIFWGLAAAIGLSFLPIAPLVWLGATIFAGVFAASHGKPDGLGILSKLRNFLSPTKRLENEMARRQEKIDKIEHIKQMQMQYAETVKKADPQLGQHLATRFRAEALYKVRKINDKEVAKAEVRDKHPLATKLPGATTAIRMYNKI